MRVDALKKSVDLETIVLDEAYASEEPTYRPRRKRDEVEE
jgi:hypothetical protein